MRNRDALQRHIEESFASKTSEEVLRLLDEASIANARMNSVESFLQHEQLQKRGRVRTVDTPCGPVMSFLPALTISGLSPRMDPIPAVGQHNRSILAELGLEEKT
jgi:crotonobetainyl-CoA:carnitine CoA-transferase CaiB-like acyl-CoA transferase